MLEKYFKKWGQYPSLVKETLYYFEELEMRAKYDILWNNECAILGLDDKTRLAQNRNILKLLKKERFEIGAYM